MPNIRDRSLSTRCNAPNYVANLRRAAVFGKVLPFFLEVENKFGFS